MTYPKMVLICSLAWDRRTRNRVWLWLTVITYYLENLLRQQPGTLPSRGFELPAAESLCHRLAQPSRLFRHQPGR
jgi:hypothetical protein